MVITLKIIFILFSFYKFCFLHDSFDNNLNDKFFSNQTSNNESIEYYVKIFPITYLAYIINGFLPNISTIIPEEKKKYFNISLPELFVSTPCFKSYLNQYYKSNVTLLFNTIRYSGKTYPDFGDEEGCITNNNAFLLICINFNIDSPKNYNGKYKILPFITKGYSFYGLCIQNTTDCTEGLVNSSMQVIKGLQELIRNTYDINVFIHHPNTEKNLKYKKRKTVFAVLFYIIIIYIVLRLSIDIFGLNFFKEDDFQKKKNSDSDSSSDEEEEEEDENEDSKIKKNNDDPNKNLLIEKNSNDKILNKDKYPKLYFLYNLCSLKLSFRNILRYYGILYEETDLYLILFFKAISLLLKTLYMTNYLMLFTPSKEMNNIAFFDTYLIYFIRYSSFSDIIFIMSESILVAYKLMSFIRKYTDKNEEPSYKLFINFFLRIIPSIVTVLIYFFILYFLSEGMMNFFMRAHSFNKTRMQHFRNNLINCYSCINEATSLIPFNIQYKNFNFDYSSFNEINYDDKECFQFMIIMTNLFYCFIFFILLIYISYKIKNSKFDLIIVIALLCYFIIPNNWLMKGPKNDYFNISFLFGENYTTKFTHLFINYYFLGFLIGLSIFYSNDITHEKSLSNSPIHKPFYFLQDIIGYIYLRSPLLKIIILLLLTGLQLIISCSFFFYSKRDFKFDLKNMEMNSFDRFLLLNEKSILALLLGLAITILYTFKNESIIKGFCNNIIVVLFNRVGYGYYAFIEIMVNYMFCYIELEIQLNSTNILFMTFGIIFYILVLNIILVACFEVPAKFLTKKMLQYKTDEKKIFLI